LNPKPSMRLPHRLLTPVASAVACRVSGFGCRAFSQTLQYAPAGPHAVRGQGDGNLPFRLAVARADAGTRRCPAGAAA
ncbi:MAG: hypothetical protein ACPIOQ_62490, partial [Promethearchaeia archaeon]